MPIVERYAEIASVLQKEIDPVQNQECAIGRFRQRILVPVMAVRVGKIGESGGEEGQRCAVPTFRRQDKQGDDVLRSAVARQACCVDSAPYLRWKAPSGVGAPAAVFQVIVVKMYGAIEIGARAPVHGLAMP